MPAILILYGTEGCHLCEDAQAVLADIGLAWRDIDIADDDLLLARYDIRIPVLTRQDNGAELDWPFTREDVLRLTRNATA